MTKEQNNLLEALNNGELFTYLIENGYKLSKQDLLTCLIELSYAIGDKLSTISERKALEKQVGEEIKRNYF